jgi:hypothetical protein
MRSALVLGLLVTLCANAETVVHHLRTRHHVTVQPRYVRPSGMLQVSRLSTLTAGAVRVLDPSTFGGG